MASVIGAGFGGQPLWVANYGATCPSMPSGWNKWKFFQSSESGVVGGVSGKVDLDFFNGSFSDLQAFAAATQIHGSATASAPESAPVSDSNDDESVPSSAPAVAGCHSDTLGANVAAYTCVDSIYEGGYYQCYDGKWYAGGEDGTGPYGPCAN
jgi:hypothetical protein